MEQKVIIMGGGPAGLAAAIYLARARMNPLLFAGDPPGGQLMLTSEIENFPGVHSLNGAELIAIMRKQAEEFGAHIVDANITNIKASADKHEITTDSTEYASVSSKTLLVATGAKALWLGLDSETKFRGKGVSACATCDGFFFRNKTVAVIGGGDTALEDALQLTRFATKVYVIHRRDSFRASSIMRDRVLQHEKIEVIWNASVEEITGAEKVSGIKLLLLSGERKELAVEGVFVAIGHKPDTELVSGLIDCDKKGYIITFQSLAERMARQGNAQDAGRFDPSAFATYHNSATSMPGIFAAGDCVDFTYRQASTASGMGVAASLDIERYLEAHSG